MGESKGVSAGEFAGVGIQFAVVILVFTFAGVWLDRRLGTSPWLVIVCVFAGAAGGFYSMISKLNKAQRTEKRDGK
jgi:F0F1-type ATP synthase assembly protein I